MIPAAMAVTTASTRERTAMAIFRRTEPIRLRPGRCRSSIASCSIVPCIADWSGAAGSGFKGNRGVSLLVQAAAATSGQPFLTPGGGGPKWRALATSRHAPSDPSARAEPKGMGRPRRGRSSVGRAPQSHCGGQGFKSPRLHQHQAPARYSLFARASSQRLIGNLGCPHSGHSGDNRWRRFVDDAASTKSRYAVPASLTVRSRSCSGKTLKLGRDLWKFAQIEMSCRPIRRRCAE
jgi:hypothetical protein